MIMETMAPAPAPAKPPPAWLAWVGALVAVALGAVSSVWEAFLTPLSYQWVSGGHAHSVRLPVAVVLAVAGNAALVWFTRAATGRTIVVMAPFLAWVVPMLVAGGRTREGDLVIAGNNWVGLVTIFAGATTFAAVAYWLTIRSLPRPPRT
jgi:hypothetical protein